MCRGVSMKCKGKSRSCYQCKERCWSVLYDSLSLNVQKVKYFLLFMKFNYVVAR